MFRSQVAFYSMFFCSSSRWLAYAFHVSTNSPSVQFFLLDLMKQLSLAPHIFLSTSLFEFLHLIELLPFSGNSKVLSLLVCSTTTPLIFMSLRHWKRNETYQQFTDLLASDEDLSQVRVGIENFCLKSANPCLAVSILLLTSLSGFIKNQDWWQI